MRFLYGVITRLAYEGEGEGDAAAQAAAAEAAAAEAKARAEAEAAAKGIDGQGKTFTQEQMNKILADDRRKHKAQVDKHVQELEQLRKSKSLNDQERSNLTAKIEELQNSVLTKEQRAAKEQEKLKKDLQDTTQQLTADRDAWKNRFHTSQVKQAITSEAAAHKAFDSDALIAILGPATRLVEVLDEESKPTGDFVPKTRFQDKDKEGKVVTLDLPVPEAVQRMKDNPRYGYLFESTAKSGLGGSSGQGGRGGEVDPSTMGTEAYREWRKKQGLNKV